MSYKVWTEEELQIIDRYIRDTTRNNKTKIKELAELFDKNVSSVHHQYYKRKNKSYAKNNSSDKKTTTPGNGHKEIIKRDSPNLNSLYERLKVLHGELDDVITIMNGLQEDINTLRDDLLVIEYRRSSLMGTGYFKD